MEEKDEDDETEGTGGNDALGLQGRRRGGFPRLEGMMLWCGVVCMRTKTALLADTTSPREEGVV